MSTVFTVRAPGKLFVLGEYAVLDGGPAIVAAVDRHIEVRAVPADRFRLDSVDLHAAIEFTRSDIPVPAGPLRFAIAAVQAAADRLPEWRGALRIEIGSGLDAPGGVKLGLGASAAVSAAVAGAVFAAAGRRLDDRRCRDEVFAAALSAHRRAQGGGSGGDVAASVYGGVRLFCPEGAGGPRSSGLALPRSAVLLAGWTGEQGSTARAIELYRGAANGLLAARTAFREASRACVDDFVACVANGAIPSLALIRACAALRDLDRALGLAVFTARLQRLVEAAAGAGAAAKPSGAGGGDCGIALTGDGEVAERVREAWRAAGIVPLDLQVDELGVTHAAA